MNPKFIIWIFGQDFSSSLLKIFWPIFIIIVVGNTLNVWWLLSVSSFLAIVISAVIWKYIDQKDFKKWFTNSVYFLSFMYIARAIVPHPFVLLITDAINKIVTPMTEIPFDKYLYDYIHRFKESSFVINVTVFISECMYLFGCLAMVIYFWMLEYLWFEYNYFSFAFIFFIFWAAVLWMKAVMHTRDN